MNDHWTMVSALANSFTAIITLVAFIVAFCTYRKEYATKLKIDVSKEPVLIPLFKNNLQDYSFVCAICNVSNRAITITNISLCVKPGDNLFSTFTKPVYLKPAEMLKHAVRIPNEQWINKLWVDEYRTNLANRKAEIIIETISGSRKFKTKTSIIDLLELRRQHPNAQTISNDPEKIEQMREYAEL